MTIERFDCGTHYDGGVMLDSDDGEYVYHKDYSALEAKCAALAAENAALKSFLGECVVPQSEGNWTGNGEKTVYVSAVDWMPPTPATDAFSRELQAQGVEMYAANLDSGADDAERGGFDDAVKFLQSEASAVRLFAANVHGNSNGGAV